MARNVTGRAGGKRWQIEFENLKEVRVTFQQIADVISGTLRYQKDNAAAATIISEAFVEVSHYLRDKIRSNAAGRGVPNRVQAAVFAFTDMDKGRTSRKQRSTLVGVRKGAPPRKDSRLYVEWGGHGRHGGSGANLGMSLATIFEKGTKRGIKPRRYFRDAYFSARSTILVRITAAYKSAIESFNR